MANVWLLVHFLIVQANELMVMRVGLVMVGAMVLIWPMA